jgi:hypothetical protein
MATLTIELPEDVTTELKDRHIPEEVVHQIVVRALKSWLHVQAEMVVDTARATILHHSQEARSRLLIRLLTKTDLCSNVLRDCRMTSDEAFTSHAIADLLVRVYEIHERIIARTGGIEGLRDAASLHAAVARPFITFAGEDLYPDDFDKIDENRSLFERLARLPYDE